MMDDPEWRVPDWFIVQHAARINFQSFAKQAGLPEPTGPNDPLMTIYTNVAIDYDWAMKMAEQDKYDALNRS